MNEDKKKLLPSFNVRGYYSESITDPDAKVPNKNDAVGGVMKNKIIWKVRTEEDCPVLQSMIQTKKPVLLAPAERWLTFKDDQRFKLPIGTFKPKVQLEERVRPFTITRNVALERLRREYEKVDIVELLKDYSISTEDLLPIDVLPPVIESKNLTRFLPLELFDDEEFESMTPKSWLELGWVDNVFYPLMGQAFVPPSPKMSTYHWCNVTIHDFDTETNLWSILTMDGYQNNYNLPRIFVHFKSEDPYLFCKRLKHAINQRAEAEQIIQYRFYIDCMSDVNLENLDEEVKVKLFNLVSRGNITKLKMKQNEFDKLLDEININRNRTLNTLQFVKTVKNNAVLKNIINYNESVGKQLFCSELLEKSKLLTGMVDFQKTCKYFRWYNIYILPEIYLAMSCIVGECLNVEGMSLFTKTYGMRFIDLYEFNAIQRQNVDTIIKYLKNPWLEKLVFMVRMHLGDIGKGWFDLNLKKFETYLISKLYRFMELLKYRMQYAVRILVENSMDTLMTIVETPCLPCLSVEENYVWDVTDLITSPFMSKALPIFTLELNMNNEGSYYSTKPELFQQVLVKLLDDSLLLTHEIRQLHPFLLKNLRFPKDLCLSSVGLLSNEVCIVRERLITAYRKSNIPLIAFSKAFDVHIDFFNLDNIQYVENYKNEQHTALEIKDEISYQIKMIENLESTLPNLIYIGPYHITAENLRKHLITKRQDLKMKLLDMFALRMKQYFIEIIQQYSNIMSKLLEKPTSIEHIFEIRDWMETIPLNVKALEEQVRRYLLEYDILDNFCYNLPQEDFDNKWETIGWPYKIQQAIEHTEEYLKQEEEHFLKLQINEEFALQEKIEKFTVQVVQMSAMKDFSKVHDIAVEAKKMWKAMKEAQENGQLLNQRQKLFGVPVIPFDGLNRLLKEFEPYKNLWVSASDWLRLHEIWMDNPLVNIDSDSIERITTDLYKQMQRLIRIFADIKAVQSIAIEVKNQIDEFKPLIPLIQCLRNPGMKERHWEQFKEISGITLQWTPTITFQNCLALGIEKYMQEILQIGENATKEYGIEKTLDKMMTEWENNNLELTPYKQTGTYIMKISDEMQQLLDDHIVLTQQLSFSPFKGPFEEKINEWGERLKTTSEVIEEWIDVQRQWMYLEPILTSEDIALQLPTESRKYKSMERTWRRIMRSAVDNPNIIEYCGDRKLLESLKDANHALELIQKGITNYLETKRTVFPRLYFLSDDELLEILSQAKNPLAVQPHLRKCFENIAKLTFESDLQITQMFSAENECVNLNPTLYPTGNVENWLLLVENSMRNSVRTILGDSYKDIWITDRKEWVLNWPGQIVIAVSQIFWTLGVEDGIKNNKLNEFLQNVLLTNLDALRSLVKGTLTFIQREILSALIVIEVHARDVTQTLVELNIINVNDFDWIRQLRYYWIEEQLKVRAVNAEFQYGYEYLGNSGRLVITPLTDRCYLTLTGALHLKFGGAPAGPAGTGKTETTKDLAKAFAIQCVVFNCSDQLDFMAMGKFFKGLASSGAWACFDEFNRIDIEVLSVVAQQITTIQKAQQARMDRFFFEGVEIVLKESCAVFITMNPGYAGRTELPDNLKALFRPVSMMVPNYTLIAEISLFSFGFSNAKQLANKITTTFKLSSEQLSSQDHYDFGMRAVKTVIAVAGNLKREQPNMDEPQIVLRALRNVNVPKFLKDDLTLFSGIISDLFPRMIEEAVDFGVLEESIRNTCLEMNLEDVDDYVKKVIQLYETTIVRHGLMLVGPTGSGKTKCYEILKLAMTNLKGESQPSGDPFQIVHTYVLNPKSITMGQLYGEFDLQTHEWTDGILPSLVRIGVSSDNNDKRWYVFDGPVDAVWIENMNTVLDDNKKLCLSSGEIIKLRDTMTMMFEVADLAVASPATVSRCGMVYLEPNILGLQPFINCWLQKLPELARPFEERIRQLFDLYILPAIEFLRNNLKEILTTVDTAILTCFLNLMDFRLSPLSGKDNKPPPAPQFLALLDNLITPWMLFSLIWSIGCTCDNMSRFKFNHWLKTKMHEYNDKPQFPQIGLVYDYRLHDGGFFMDQTSDGEPQPPSWINWMENVQMCKLTIDMKYSDIEIPTIDNIRNSELIGILTTNENNVLCVGPTGTGKTLTIIGKLSKNMPKKFICDFINFSARTTANQTQDLIDSKLDRRRKGVFGPPVLKKQIFFIDDFNMPALEVYGAQPPIELIRQWMDFSGWYDRKNIGEFRQIIDVNFVVAMGPPGGGRNPITARLLRHFHYLTFLEMEDDCKRTIFGTILKFWLERVHYIDNIMEYHGTILNSTLNVFTTIVDELLPTPAKTHYTFNLRDLSKVFQGILMVQPENLKNINMLVCLWYHECCRVFQDRLINDEDRNWFKNLLKNQITTIYKLNTNETLDDEQILFVDIPEPNADIGNYTQITDIEQLITTLNYYLSEYNSQSTKPMNLVLFDDAISHLCRILRIIRQPMGNALLLGMGGSGRQSLTKLATFIAEYNCFQINLTKTYGPSDWRDDIKTVMLDAGINKRETVFLFSDTQIKSESFLEDINNILNSGDVPNIYQPDELDKIFQGMKGLVQELGLTSTKSNLFATYQKEVRTNMHTVITMSPIGDIFRARLRQFPALVNCCTIDWFQPWPDTALQSVAMHYLCQLEDLNISNDIRDGIVNIFQFMHASVVKASELYKSELSRHNYITPTSYLQLLSSYTELMNTKKMSLLGGVNRLKIGLNKLQNTADEVKILQENLRVMKPALETAAKDADVMIKKIAEDTIVAEETRAIVEKEEEEASKKAIETQTIAEDAQRDLDEAMPALIEAENSLKSLNKNDITEVRSMKRPPPGVVYVIEAICIVKNIKPKRVPGLKFGEKINDYWEPGRNMLADPAAFLTSLMNFDRDSITEEMIEKLKMYINDPQFMPAKIAKISKACTSLCMWVHAMFKYYFVNKSVAPKKAALKQAKEELQATERALALAKAKMKQILEGLEQLQTQLAAKIAFKEEKQQSITICEQRMNRAVRLINGLADEKIRWINTIETIEANAVNVTGDILICAGCIAYLTPFTDAYRKKLFNEWIDQVQFYNIPYTKNCNPITILGEPVLIRSWQLNGLPRDNFSTENAVLVAHSLRWPLFIDPQCQANKWIKNMEKQNGLVVCKLSDKELIRTVEFAIRFGKPVLIENISTELDPALDVILLRQIFNQNGTWVIKLGDAIVPYNDNFKLYITTKLPNPHYNPEIFIKVLIVNFTLVSSGLLDQLLALVVMQERPDLEEQRSQIVVSVAQMKQDLKEIQERILYKLSSSEGSPLDDSDFIIILESSKKKSDDIKNKVEAAEITQIDIDNTRALYIPVANRGQILFFCLADLSNVDPMYQYSLEWFVSLFINSIAESEHSRTLWSQFLKIKQNLNIVFLADINVRVTAINEYFTFSLYSNVCRSLFEKNKLHFAFLLCVRILMDENRINQHEWHHFLAGGSPQNDIVNPASGWLSDKAWKEILALDVLSTFQPFVRSFADYITVYKSIFESNEPEKHRLPEFLEMNLNQFQKMIILKTLRPDKVTNAMQDFICNHMGQQFIEPQSADLQAMFKESSPTIPLIFVLSTGTDPAADLYKFADRMKFGKRLFSISLGQGQGPRAEKMLQSGLEIGSWVFFQNCHLAPSWMPQLERLIENIQPEMVHRDFRVWLTSTPSPNFPVSILQNGSKMTVEPPQGVKANLMRAYRNQVIDFTDFIQSDNPKAPNFKLLIFSLSLFHAILLERRKFGPLGFNIPYEFTDGDLKISISQLHMFLMEYQQIPFKVLTYTAGEINYGGRVTDDWDRRCLMNILSDYYNEAILNPNYIFDSDGFYHQLPIDSQFLDYIEYIKTVPLNDNPELFGMHSNANITFAQSQTYNCLSTLLLLQPKQIGGAATSQEEITTNAAKSILNHLPTKFDLNEISRKYPVMYNESLNTVLIQEAIRYNKLLAVIDVTLKDLLKALKGLVVMSESLDKMATSLYSNIVPSLWTSKAYPSLKPLGSWVSDLIARVNFLNKWMANGIPPAFWISGFYFPQAFLTGTLQNFARKYIISIDTINFAFKVLDEPPKSRPKDGCCVYGLFLEGARWNRQKSILDESFPKELYTEMPTVWLIPEENHQLPQNIYNCPVYKTLTRAGTLSTTGHSTNYVLTIEVPTIQPEFHWIKRGVALICALDY